MVFCSAQNDRPDILRSMMLTNADNRNAVLQPIEKP